MLSNKFTCLHMMEDSKFHTQCIADYCSQNPLNICEYGCKIKSFRRLNVLISSEGYCKFLFTGRRVTCVSAAACSGSVQVLSVDPVSHVHTVRYNLTNYVMYVQSNVW